MIDQFNVLHLLPADSRTATGNGAGFDVKDYVDQGKFILDTEGGTGTAPTLDVKLQESDDNVTFSDIPGEAFSLVTTAASTQTKHVAMDMLKQYIRAVATIGGTSPAFVCAVSMVARKQKV